MERVRDVGHPGTKAAVLQKGWIQADSIDRKVKGYFNNPTFVTIVNTSVTLAAQRNRATAGIPCTTNQEIKTRAYIAAIDKSKKINREV